MSKQEASVVHFEKLNPYIKIKKYPSLNVKVFNFFWGAKCKSSNNLYSCSFKGLSRGKWKNFELA